MNLSLFFKSGIICMIFIVVFSCKTRSREGSNLLSDGSRVTDSKVLAYRSTVALIAYLDDDFKDETTTQAPDKLKPRTFCSGTLISKRHVLTAAHCIFISTSSPVSTAPLAKQAAFTKSGKFFIGLGPDQTLPISQLTLIKVLAIDVPRPLENAPFSFLHASGNHPAIQHDIAVLTLENDVPEPFDAALVPTSEVKVDHLVSAGFGITGKDAEKFDAGILRKVLHKLVRPLVNWQRVLCTKPTSSTNLPGDSGGPLFDEKARAVVGVASYIGDHNCFTSVFSYGNWIGEVLQKNVNTDLVYESESTAPPVAFQRDLALCWIKDNRVAILDVSFSQPQPCADDDLKSLYAFSKNNSDREAVQKRYDFPKCRALNSLKYSTKLSEAKATKSFGDSIFQVDENQATNLFFQDPVPNAPDEVGESPGVIYAIFSQQSCVVPFRINYYSADIRSGSDGLKILKSEWERRDPLFILNNGTCEKIVPSVSLEIFGLKQCAN